MRGADSRREHSCAGSSWRFDIQHHVSVLHAPAYSRHYGYREAASWPHTRRISNEFLIARRRGQKVSDRVASAYSSNGDFCQDIITANFWLRSSGLPTGWKFFSTPHNVVSLAVVLASQ